MMKQCIWYDTIFVAFADIRWPYGFHNELGMALFLEMPMRLEKGMFKSIVLVAGTYGSSQLEPGMANGNSQFFLKLFGSIIKDRSNELYDM